MLEGTVITFYSYKGGAGRSFVLANVAAMLSIWGYKVLCVDWDLEAPGLHYYFDEWLQDQRRAGLTDLVEAFAKGQRPDWRDYITTFDLPKSRQRMSFMSAGKQDDAFVRRVQGLDWLHLYSENKLGDYLEEIRQAWKREFDLGVSKMSWPFVSIIGETASAANLVYNTPKESRRCHTSNRSRSARTDH